MGIQQGRRFAWPKALILTALSGAMAFAQADISITLNIPSPPPQRDSQGFPIPHNPHPDIRRGLSMFQADPGLCSASEAASRLAVSSTVTVTPTTADPATLPTGAPLDLGTNTGTTAAQRFSQDPGRIQTATTSTEAAARAVGLTEGFTPLVQPFPNDVLPSENVTGLPAPLPVSLGGGDQALMLGGDREGADPVHPGSGEFIFHATDLRLPGVGLPVHLRRLYRSRWQYDGPFGFGWTHNYNERLIVEVAPCGNRTIHWLSGEGVTIRFEESVSGQFRAAPDANVRLEAVREGGWRVVAHDGIVHRFLQDGTLAEIVDLNGNKLGFRWRPSQGYGRPPLLEHITDTLGREVNFEYTPQDHIQRVAAPALNLEVRYFVDAKRDLRTVTSVDGVVESYEYTTQTAATPAYAPTADLIPACQKKCGLAPSDCGRSVCETQAQGWRNACMSQCFRPAECKAACTGECDTACRNAPADACRNSCQQSCHEPCFEGGAAQCRTIATNIVEPACANKCFNFCFDLCRANTSCGFVDEGGLYNVACVGFDECAAVERSVGNPTRFFGNWHCDGSCPQCCMGNASACPPGSCQAESDECWRACANEFLAGDTISWPPVCRRVSHLGCIPKADTACATGCATACVGACATGCNQSCGSACQQVCDDPAPCEQNCSASGFRAACGETCMESCIQASSPVSGRYVYGSPDQYDHNLIRIRDGNLNVYVENTYSGDIHSPDFDRVTSQKVGGFAGHEISYRSYDIEAPARSPLRADDKSYVDPSPRSTEICPTICLGARPPRNPGRWVRVAVGDYLVLPDVEGLPPEVPPDGWPIDAPPELDAFAWYEIKANPEGDRLNPPLALSSKGLAIRTPQGVLSIGQQGDRRALRYSGLPAKSLAAIRAVIEKHGLSLVHTSRGWRVYPGRAIAGATVSPASACGEEFTVRDVPASQKGAPAVAIFPKDACKGVATFGELGRRRAPAQASTASTHLTKPSAETTWIFGPDLARRSAVNPRTDRWGAARPPGRDLCGLPESIPASPDCVAASAEGRLGGLRAPDCSQPWSRRGGGAAYRPGPDEDVSLPCGPEIIEIPPTIDEGCPGEQYTGPLTGPLSRVQPIARATVIRDGTGAVWTYYSSPSGAVQRIVNHALNQQTDFNYDHAGRLVSRRASSGERACMQYDANWNVTRRTYLPAPNLWAPQEQIEERFSWQDNGRLHVVFDPNNLTQPLKTFDWDPLGNLTGVRSPDNHYVAYLRDPLGRIEYVIYPTHRTHILYESPTQQWKTIVFDDSSPGQERRLHAVKRNPLGQIERYEEDGGSTAVQAWTKDGRLLSRTLTVDPTAGSQSITSVYHYDNAGVLDRIEQPERWRYIRRNGRGLVESVRMQLPPSRAGSAPARVSCFGYDGRGKLIEIVDPEGRRTRLVRDAGGDILRIEKGIWPASPDPWDDQCANNVTDNAPQATEVFYRFTRDNGRVIRMDHGPVNGPGIVEGGPGGWWEEYGYDAYGRLSETRYSTGVIRRQGYDARDLIRWQALYRPNAPPYPAGLLNGSPDPDDSNVAALDAYEYDHNARIVRHRQRWFVDEAGGRTLLGGSGWIDRSWRYLDSQLRADYTDPMGRTTSTQLDAFGRVKRQTLPGDSGTVAIEHEYGDFGRLVTRRVTPASTSTGALVTTSRFTDFGSVKEVRDGANELLYHAEHDSHGRPVRAADRSVAHRYEYDFYGDLEAILRERADGTREPYIRYRRNRNAVVDQYRDGLDHLWQWQFDHANRVRTEISPDNTTATNSYWGGSRWPRAITDRNGIETQYEYDAYKAVRKISASNAGASAGWQAASTLEFEQNLLGLSSAKALNDPQSASDDVTYSYLRDSLGNAVRFESSLFPQAPVQTAHDEIGRPRRVAVSGQTIERSYDIFGRVREVRLGPGQLVRYSYPGYGLAGSVTYANGIREERTFDDEGRISGTQATLGGQGAWSSQKYWANNGSLNRLDRWTPAGPRLSSVFFPDEFGRLNAALHDIPGLSSQFSGTVTPPDVSQYLASARLGEGFRMDAADNWQERYINNVPVPVAVGADNRYSQLGGVVSSDAEGRVLALPDNTHYGHDGLGRLVSAVTPSNETWRFRYDAFGNVVAWEAPNDTGVLQYVDNVLVREASPASATNRLHIMGNHPGPIAVAEGASRVYNHYTWGQRIDAATDATGAVVERYLYDSYGTASITDPNHSPRTATQVGNRFHIAGQLYFSRLNLHRFGQRWYKPDLGRYLSADPAGFVDGANQFAYAGSQPVMYIDPSGMWRQGLNDAAWAVYNIAGNLVGGAVEGLVGIPGRTEEGYEIVYALGEGLGGLAGMVLDAAGMAGGGAIGIGGVTVCVSGVGCLAGGPATAAGAALATASLGAFNRVHGPKISDSLGTLDDALGSNIFNESINQPPSHSPGSPKLSKAELAKQLPSESNVPQLSLPLENVGSNVHPQVPPYSKGKTLGVFSVDGIEVRLVSGEKGPGEWLLENLPAGVGSGLTRAWTHVEGHAAALMHKYGIKEAELFINQAPCATGAAKCQSVIQKLLPPGSKLKVHYLNPDGSVGIGIFEAGVEGFNPF